MTPIQAILLGIVEGITEFLPISSTAHLVLTAQALGIPQGEFAKTFEIAIQAGAIAAVVALYGKRLMTDKETFVRVCAAFIPTAVIGLALHKVVKNILLESTTVIFWALALGGALLILFELLHKEERNSVADVRSIPVKHAMLVGVFQAVAIIPGVSRAAATIVGGLLLGISRKTIVEFSFLLAVPTILAATALDLAKSSTTFTAGEWQLLALGAAVSFVVALVVIRWLVRFIQGHSFIVFGVERIVIVAAALLFLR